MRRLFLTESRRSLRVPMAINIGKMQMRDNQLEELKADRNEWWKQATNLLTNTQPAGKKFLEIF